MLIRSEKQKDCEAVYAVNEKAFETSAETRLVDILREQVQPIIYIICEESLDIVGISCFHLLYCPDILSSS